jgi:hypothetical protein
LYAGDHSCTSITLPGYRRVTTHAARGPNPLEQGKESEFVSLALISFTGALFIFELSSYPMLVVADAIYSGDRLPVSAFMDPATFTISPFGENESLHRIAIYLQC